MDVAYIMEYPKINSLYKREGMTLDPVTGKNVFSKAKKHPLIIGDYALPEYDLIKYWQVFEKIDGTNIRVTYDGSTVRFEGRTKNSSIPSFLYKYLQDTFTVEKMAKAFPDVTSVILYGEGYGSKIQVVGGYRDDVSFICFDILAENKWWLQHIDRLDICQKLQIDHVPCLGMMREQEMIEYVKTQPISITAYCIDQRQYPSEGIVATTEPILLQRNGQPLKFKLRCEDFK